MNKDRARGVGEKVHSMIGDLPGETKLDDLFNYHMDAGKAAGNPPSAWLTAMENLSSAEKQTITSVIGMFNRVLYKQEGVDITLGYLKSIDVNSLVGLGNGRWSITKEGANLLKLSFGL